MSSSALEKYEDNLEASLTHTLHLTSFSNRFSMVMIEMSRLIVEVAAFVPEEKRPEMERCAQKLTNLIGEMSDLARIIIMGRIDLISSFTRLVQEDFTPKVKE